MERFQPTSQYHSHPASDSFQVRDAALELSLLIPAYNESRRLPPYLHAIKAHLGQLSLTYEVIIVDDGSTDSMLSSLGRFLASWPQLRIVSHATNSGRGRAIRTGNAVACGDLVLYVDADGATPITEEAKLRAAISNGADIAVGSRVIRPISHEKVYRRRTLIRALISKVYGRLVRLLVNVPARDAMCGFKMWRRRAGHAILAYCSDNHWLLDVELLAVAQRLGYRVAEVPVSWSETPGSKVNLLRDALRILPGLWRIRRALQQIQQEPIVPIDAENDEKLIIDERE
jgi:dolichyl-phosphate beta-glucosyltransferase